jgi:hypothetical protein
MPLFFTSSTSSLACLDARRCGSYVACGSARSEDVMYEKSSSVTLGGDCLLPLPKGEKRETLLPQKAERHEPMVSAATRRRVLASAVGGIWSMCVDFAKELR